MNYWLDFSHTKPLVIGHRGASAHAPENTLAAFHLAWAQGAAGIEFDVKRARSGEVVIMHDETVDRTTNGNGKTHELTLSELRKLDAGNGERVPLLDEVFEQLGKLSAASGRPFIFNVEVTNYFSRGDGLEAAVVQVVRQHKMAERVLFSSFNPFAVHKLAQLAPDIPRAILYSPDMPIYLRKVWLGPFVPHQFRHPEKVLVDAACVRQLLGKHLRVNTWTVNERADIARMLQAGVNGIIGDSPQTMREVIENAS
jgi:glycerophosphoryl diester phosphodiesterase